MNAAGYINILENSLIPFLQDVYPSHHRFMQDNDPKHTSRYVRMYTHFLDCFTNRAARAFFEENDINWWNTPPESPECNPIENLWHELKVGDNNKYGTLYALISIYRSSYGEKSSQEPNKSSWTGSRHFGGQ